MSWSSECHPAGLLRPARAMDPGPQDPARPRCGQAGPWRRLSPGHGPRRPGSDHPQPRWCRSRSPDRPACFGPCSFPQQRPAHPGYGRGRPGLRNRRETAAGPGLDIRALRLARPVLGRPPYKLQDDQEKRLSMPEEGDSTDKDRYRSGLTSHLRCQRCFCKSDNMMRCPGTGRSARGVLHPAVSNQA